MLNADILLAALPKGWAAEHIQGVVAYSVLFIITVWEITNYCILVFLLLQLVLHFLYLFIQFLALFIYHTFNLDTLCNELRLKLWKSLHFWGIHSGLGIGFGILLLAVIRIFFFLRTIAIVWTRILGEKWLFLVRVFLRFTRPILFLFFLWVFGMDRTHFYVRYIRGIVRVILIWVLLSDLNLCRLKSISLPRVLIWHKFLLLLDESLLLFKLFLH